MCLCQMSVDKTKAVTAPLLMAILWTSATSTGWVAPNADAAGFLLVGADPWIFLGVCAHDLIVADATTVVDVSIRNFPSSA